MSWWRGMLKQIQRYKHLKNMEGQCLKDERVGWLLLNCINTLQKVDETVKAFNKQ